MDRGIRPFFIVVILLVASFASAQEGSTYFNFDVGAVKAKYWGELQGKLDTTKQSGGLGSTATGFGLGIYWPLRDAAELLLGASVVNYTDGVRMDPTMSSPAETLISMFDTSLSGMWFMGGSPGNGVFFRGDIGLSRLKDTTNGTDRTYMGTNTLIGGGYGMAVSSFLNVLISIHYTTYEFDSKPVQTYSYKAALFF